MPERFHIEPCWSDVLGNCDGDGRRYIADASYQLRPEAIESVFILYRITSDSSWQEKGWDMFQAIMKHTTTPIANARLSDVTSMSPGQEDSMESFWLAEALKYFYLLLSEPDVVSLNDFVL
jgi:mannosyl-oligosaccharide alpha-1,2-mannosidase